MSRTRKPKGRPERAASWNPRRPMSRRAILGGLGGVAIGLPFLNAMEEKRAVAQELPKRLVVVFSANGTIPSAWTPTGSGSNFQFGPILAPLEPIKDKVIVVDDVDMEVAYNSPGDGHQTGMGTMLTGTALMEGDEFCLGSCEDPTNTVGWGGGISVDQFIAEQVGQTTKFGSLELGVQVGSANIWSRMVYQGPAIPVPPEDDPALAYDRIFGELAEDPFGLAKKREQRHRVLDAVMEDYGALNQRLGAEDRAKLENHLDAIREIEKRIDAGGQLGGSCQLPDLGETFDYQQNDNFPQAGRLMMDLLVMSLACDLTRVASLQWGRSVSNVRMSWLGIPEGHHELSHEPNGAADAQNKLTQINTWYAEQFYYLLAAMDAVPEGDGTMLDNTVVLWCNELGIGNSHTRRDVPFVLGGSCGGALQTGRYVQGGGAFHNNLLVSLCNAMDVDVTTFGDPSFCTGPLAGL